MKIYFSAPIRGVKGEKDQYPKMIEHMRSFGEVLTEHIGDKSRIPKKDVGLSAERIYNRDMGMLRKADLFIAEVSSPSIGVGYEIAWAEANGKKVLCLYRPQKGKRLSAMVKGNKNLILKEYRTIEKAFAHIDRFVSSQM
ncbi:MAG: nucleoside 2-deoxyribosyltransferase [Candidatus Micrarchaeota archaeon]|nr:nucleoside 2-deoxyribosyltransferase [Candidatus Micrarchaeota archaeon]MDE1804282.1 nucleoside 2-deoxyribosyltransferase [Candidatus Micrarchaeota archaeon]MDE1846847.1 nucleoside 2-deoxyribosyltransferase [Candidatus Micrarchaeota archaeon]